MLEMLTESQKEELRKRITRHPAILGGKPVIRGHRLAVEHVLEMLEAGDTDKDLLAAYSWLEQEDIDACRKMQKPQ